VEGRGRMQRGWRRRSERDRSTYTGLDVRAREKGYADRAKGCDDDWIERTRTRTLS
jgi:hypothetical protein